MAKYEMVFILDARMSDAEKTEASKLVTDTVAKHGGKVIDNIVWLEKQRLSFPMKKVWDGTYYLSHFEMPGPEVAKLRRDLQIVERLLRFQILSATEINKV